MNRKPKRASLSDPDNLNSEQDTNVYGEYRNNYIIKAPIYHKCVSSGQGSNQYVFLKNGQPIPQSHI